MTVIINVARKRLGSMPPRHIFRTAPDSIYTKEDAIRIAKQLSAVYPSPGYEITISAESTHSEYVDWTEEK